MRKINHIGIPVQKPVSGEVYNLDSELENAKVLLPKTIVNEHLTIAFIEEEGIALELMQFN